MIFFACLAAIAVLGLVARPADPHIAVERLPLFWSLFGLAGCTGLALVCKWIARVLLERKSDYYDS